MKKPTVFVSSTIYDFSDLRSALKYWLGEMGFNAQLSEYSDFQKNLTVNSYDACLQSVAECDYFVLLVGTRRGGMYPGEDISITRKEYRVAYELAKAGKIKKLIVFIRQNVWDVREDRKSLHDLLHNVTVLEKDISIDVGILNNYNSNILRDAGHIIGFIDEITRKEDAKSGNMPNMNWIHTFNSFEDIISTLKIEFRIKTNLSVQIAEQNIKMALVHTLQKITYKNESDKVAAYFLPFADVRAKLQKFRNENERLYGNETICLTKQELNNISSFILFCHTGVEELNTYEFESALSSGVFLGFDVDKGVPIYNNFCRMLHQMIEEINRLKRLVQEFSSETRQKMLKNLYCYNSSNKDSYEFELLDLSLLSSIYERLINIQEISFYLSQYMESHNEKLALPTILNGLIDSERPSESDILKIFG